MRHFFFHTIRDATDAVVAYVKKNQRLRYPDGVLTAPKQRVGGVDLRTGVVGSSLLVSFDVPK
jgi:hypothetical protein